MKLELNLRTMKKAAFICVHNSCRSQIVEALTSKLALGKVPFYCAAWCNVKSVRNAIRSGFRPAWVEITARDVSFVDKMNRVEG